MSAKAFIFDMDGTMIDSMPAHTRSWGAFAQRHGLGLDGDQVLRRILGMNAIECVRELLGADVPEARALELAAEKEALFRELFAADFREIAGFRAFAQAARGRGLKLAMATAGDRDNIAFTLKHLGLPQALDAAVGGDEGLPGKPDPALFLEAARRTGVAPADCIVFEDAPAGIEAARRAGMRAVALCTGHSPEQLAGPHVIAHARDFEQLTSKNFLESLDA